MKQVCWKFLQSFQRKTCVEDFLSKIVSSFYFSLQYN